jgi:predicted ATP-binding protein involved in virulence
MNKMENEKLDKQINANHSYFYSLELEGVNCFKEMQTLDLSDGKGSFSPWTIILGDNGTGKTTLLKVLDRMQPSLPNLVNNNFYLSILWTYKPFLKSNYLEIKLTLSNNEVKHFVNHKIGNNNAKTGALIPQKNNYFPFLLSYGASRRMSKNLNLSDKVKGNLNYTTLFDESLELINVEEWYLQKYLSYTTSKNGVKIKLKQQLDLIELVLIDFLPEVTDLRIKEVKNLNEKSGLEVRIDNTDWIDLRDLSFGYQTITALLVDISSNMMDKYPESEHPLSEPVIILIDEIDLHLHPKWQRTVIEKLSHHFPKAQFIVTAHSPLIVQAAEDFNANIVVCRKEGDRVVIDNDIESVKGWRVDQILTSDLFDLSSSKSVETESLQNEKINLLMSDSLTTKNKKRLKEIDKALDNTPVFSDKESIDAETLIKKAAQLLNK